MTCLRLLAAEHVHLQVPCCRCLAPGLGWDRIMGKAYCPDCEESLAQGEADPLVERAEPQPCSVCEREGTLRFLTFPLDSSTPVEIPLCGRHVRELLGRRLDPDSFLSLREQLGSLRLDVTRIFLLHDAFYDADGNALQPAIQLE